MSGPDQINKLSDDDGSISSDSPHRVFLSFGVWIMQSHTSLKYRAARNIFI